MVTNRELDIYSEIEEFLKSFIANPLKYLFWALLILAILLAAFFAISSVIRRIRMKKGFVPEPALSKYREGLVEAVGEASQTKGAQIKLRNFWRGKKLSISQRYFILDSLIRSQVFYKAYSNDKVIAFFQRLSWDFLSRPASWVQLSEQKWTKLASGASPNIVAGNDVIVVSHSPGVALASKSTNVSQRVEINFSQNLVTDVAKALRLDASNLIQGHHLRKEAEAFADQLDSYARKSEWSKAKETLARVVKFAESSASLWASTMQIFAANS